jgi:hypothetical protein
LRKIFVSPVFEKEEQDEGQERGIIAARELTRFFTRSRGPAVAVVLRVFLHLAAER